ncbi:MAG TPA: hypothetical protein PJ982_03745, partial [Lacipirellulaceae bacterium]|nr:hypothetical protein [Lacipirellulaceae bacterium]
MGRGLRVDPVAAPHAPGRSPNGTGADVGTMPTLAPAPEVRPAAAQAADPASPRSTAMSAPALKLASRTAARKASQEPPIGRRRWRAWSASLLVHGLIVVGLAAASIAELAPPPFIEVLIG